MTSMWLIASVVIIVGCAVWWLFFYNRSWEHEVRASMECLDRLDLEGADAHLKKALGIAESLAANDPRRMIVELDMARLQLLRGNSDSAEEIILSVMSRCNDKEGIHKHLWHRAVLNFAEAKARQGAQDEADQWFAKAIDLRSLAYGESSEEAKIARLAFCKYLIEVGRGDEAGRIMKDS